MKKIEYQEGPDARKNFEDAMKKLFRVPKTAIRKPPKQMPKKEGSEK
jgi:hypothetical protein